MTRRRDRRTAISRQGHPLLQSAEPRQPQNSTKCQEQNQRCKEHGCRREGACCRHVDFPANGVLLHLRDEEALRYEPVHEYR